MPWKKRSPVVLCGSGHRGCSYSAKTEELPANQCHCPAPLPCLRADAFSLPVPADPVLSHRLRRELERSLGKDAVAEGLNATADSFYSSQASARQREGRREEGAWSPAAMPAIEDRNHTLLALLPAPSPRLQGRVSLFDDRNHTLLGDLVAKYPNLLTLEMETFHLLDLARCSNGTMVAAAAAIALADRRSNDFLQGELSKQASKHGCTGPRHPVLWFCRRLPGRDVHVQGACQTGRLQGSPYGLAACAELRLRALRPVPTPQCLRRRPPLSGARAGLLQRVIAEGPAPAALLCALPAAERIEELERAAGQACLTALAAHHLVDEWDLTERGVKPVWVA